jgi:hypothetical protein
MFYSNKERLNSCEAFFLKKKKKDNEPIITYQLGKVLLGFLTSLSTLIHANISSLERTKVDPSLQNSIQLNPFNTRASLRLTDQELLSRDLLK